MTLSRSLRSLVVEGRCHGSQILNAVVGAVAVDVVDDVGLVSVDKDPDEPMHVKPAVLAVLVPVQLSVAIRVWRTANRSVKSPVYAWGHPIKFPVFVAITLGDVFLRWVRFA